MAEYLITGGGTALDDALNMRNGFLYKDGDTLLVGPGIYSHVNFGKYVKDITVKSTDGKENTIIDATGQTTCLRNRYLNRNYVFNFYDLTLRNGYVYSDLSIPGVDSATTYGAVDLYDCCIYDCSAWHDVDNITDFRNGFNRIAACGNTDVVYRNCEISGCVGLSTNVFYRGTAIECDIHDNIYEAIHSGDKAGFIFVGGLIRSKFHHNKLNGIGILNGKVNSSLIYENYADGITNSWLIERGVAKNSIIAKNRNFGHIENSFGQATQYENCVFVENEPHTLTGQHGTIYLTNGKTRFFNCAADILSSKFNWSGSNTTYTRDQMISGNIWNIKSNEMGFVDYENNDFRLTENSPLKGMGIDAYYDPVLSTVAVFTDSNSKYDMENRPFKDPPSIGAFEHYELTSNLPNKAWPVGGKKDND